MAQLNDDIRRFIVQALACYDTPTQVANDVKEEFGLTLTRQQVAGYDYTKATCKGLAKKWRDLFDATRVRFLDEAAEIPIAKQSFRLRALQTLYNRAVTSKNVVLAAQLLEQAAKEIGGAMTNRRELTGKDGKPLAVAHTSITKEELAAAVQSVREDY